MGLLTRLAGFLKNFRNSASGGARRDGNVIDLSASKRERAKTAQRQRRAHIEAEREKRWNSPSK